MINSAIWVIVANDNDAPICANINGDSSLLRVVTRRHNAASSAHDAKLNFATQIMGELLDGALHGAYDGVIVFANQALMSAIDQVTVSQVRKLLLAQVVEDPTATALPDAVLAQMRVAS